jgi:hypothetical protein
LEKKNLAVGLFFIAIIVIIGVVFVIADGGFTSFQGLQGIQGIQGLAGNNGVNGINFNASSPYIYLFNGTQGIQGLTGLTGATGSQGLQGIQGIAGTNGINSVVSAVTSANGLSLSGGTLSYSQQSITHSQISDWSTATSGFLTSQTVSAVTSANGLSLSGGTLSFSASPTFTTVNGYTLSTEFGYLNQAVLTTSTPTFVGLAISTISPTLTFYDSTAGGMEFQINDAGGVLTFVNAGVFSGIFKMTLDSYGNLVTVGYCASANYLSGAYGATWGSLPSFPTAVNGNYYVLYDTTTATSRIYCHSNGGWHWSALT